MKPVIKKQTTYSVLFMRDDCGVMRFRLRACWLKALCALTLLLALTAGGGAWAAHYYWKKHSVLAQEHRELEKDMVESRRQLERLANLEKFLQSREVAQTRVSTDGANATAPVQAALSAAGNGAVTAPTPTPESTPKPQAAEHTAKISNFSLRASSSHRLRLSFDLANQTPQQTLTGRVNLALVTTSGSTVDVPGSDDDLRFYRIARYKKIITTFNLPADIPASGLSAVQVTIDSEGNPPYVERFPMP